ncbi:transglycosylase SLT domain-containing protein [Myxococcota bacterium]|nr:transglycosylase SLT domain-containing protein [Myxococcota bacterium]
MPTTNGLQPANYTVQSGDSFYAIADAHGVSSQSLLTANPQISSAALIHPGDTLHLPNDAKVVRTYVVAAGDSFGKIARKIYGRSSMWKTIYSANRHLVLTPHGQLISLPASAKIADSRPQSIAPSNINHWVDFDVNNRDVQNLPQDEQRAYDVFWAITGKPTLVAELKMHLEVNDGLPADQIKVDGRSLTLLADKAELTGFPLTADGIARLHSHYGVREAGIGPETARVLIGLLGRAPAEQESSAAISAAVASYDAGLGTKAHTGFFPFLAGEYGRALAKNESGGTKWSLQSSGPLIETVQRAINRLGIAKPLLLDGRGGPNTYQAWADAIKPMGFQGDVRTDPEALTLLAEAASSAPNLSEVAALRIEFNVDLSAMSAEEHGAFQVFQVLAAQNPEVISDLKRTVFYPNRVPGGSAKASVIDAETVAQLAKRSAQFSYPLDQVGVKRLQDALYLKEDGISYPMASSLNEFLRYMIRGGMSKKIDNHKYDSKFIAEANKRGVPSSLLKAVAAMESRFNPNARSPVGALGLMQFMPGTAKEQGVTNPRDPSQAIAGGARYLQSLATKYSLKISEKSNGLTSTWPLAVAGYNAGMGNVLKYRGTPPFSETQHYVARVLLTAGLYKARHDPEPTR